MNKIAKQKAKSINGFNRSMSYFLPIRSDIAGKMGYTVTYKSTLEKIVRLLEILVCIGYRSTVLGVKRTVIKSRLLMPAIFHTKRERSSQCAAMD